MILEGTRRYQGERSQQQREMQVGSLLPGSAPQNPRYQDSFLAKVRKGSFCSGGQRASFTASHFHPGNRRFFPATSEIGIIGFLKIIIKMRKLSGVTRAGWLGQSRESHSLEEAQTMKQPNLLFTDVRTEASQPGWLAGGSSFRLSLGHSLFLHLPSPRSSQNSR